MQRALVGFYWEDTHFQIIRCFPQNLTQMLSHFWLSATTEDKSNFPSQMFVTWPLGVKQHSKMMPKVTDLLFLGSGYLSKGRNEEQNVMESKWFPLLLDCSMFISFIYIKLHISTKRRD